MQSNHSGDADRVVDVRDIPGEPFGEIMTALSELPAGDTLLLIAPFEPEPLYEVLRDREFGYETTHPEDDRWCVYIEAS
jgi:uncharacterized protein (DUF2249 family)